MATPSPTLTLTSELIRRPSVTPDDGGCQDILIQRLEAMDFVVERLPFEDVSNFWAVRGTTGPLFCFAGHTDVVPADDPARWRTDPFQPVLRDNLLYGRGAADMKGSLAAMITATEDFVGENPTHKGRIAYLITSDEEGIAVNGTVRVVDWLLNQSIRPDWCLVGEPSSSRRLGDTIKHGRRGSLNATITIKGVEGHVAYPDLANNPIHLAAPALTDLTREQWDQGNDHFPATTFQISNIHAGTGTTNVIPGVVVITCNFRFSTELNAAQIKSRVAAILDRHELIHSIDWQLSGQPFLTAPGDLVDAVRDSIRTHTGITAELSTAGGTSDGRFIATLGTQVVELGPVNASIHKVDEHVTASDLDVLSTIYRGVLARLFN